MVKRQSDICELFCYNKDKVNVLKKSMVSGLKITNLAEKFKILGDNTRIKILLALSKGELCVCDIAHVLGLSLSAVSHQLRLLRNLEIVKYRNEGRMAFYTLNNGHIMDLVKEGIKHNGFSFIEVLQPCLIFHPDKNYKEKIYSLEESGHDKNNFDMAWKKAGEFDYNVVEKIPVGVFYQAKKPVFEEQFQQLRELKKKRMGWVDIHR